MADGEGHVEPVELSLGSESEAEAPSRNLKPLEGATSVVIFLALMQTVMEGL